MEFEGAQAPMMYGAQAMKPVGGGRNMVQPSQGYTCEATHYIPGGDEHVLVCPAPWVHKGRIFPGVPAMCVDQQKYEVNWAPAPECGAAQPKPTDEHEMPDPVFPPAHHASNFAADLDMDNQRQLEEQIAHEILLLSQKLANLQGRYGARRVATDNAKPAVLSCPQTPLLLDNRDVKCNSARIAPNQSMNDDTSQLRPATSSSSRASHRQSESRYPVMLLYEIALVSIQVLREYSVYLSSFFKISKKAVLFLRFVHWFETEDARLMNESLEVGLWGQLQEGHLQARRAELVTQEQWRVIHIPEEARSVQETIV